MLGAVMHAPGDVQVETRPDPQIIEPTDAIIRVSAACICGSDLWPWRGIEKVGPATPMGHEYVGVVKEVGSDVATIKPGQFVIGSFFASDNTCRDLPGWVPKPVRECRIDGPHRHPGRVRPHSAGRRNIGGHTGAAAG